MIVRYSRRATADLGAIAEYLRERSQAGAANVEKGIRDAIGLLEDFPQLGRERPELGVRALIVPRYRYTIYYRLEDETVWIVHIRDGRRKPLVAGEV